MLLHFYAKRNTHRFGEFDQTEVTDGMNWRSTFLIFSDDKKSELKLANDDEESTETISLTKPEII